MKTSRTKKNVFPLVLILWTSLKLKKKREVVASSSSPPSSLPHIPLGTMTPCASHSPPPQHSRPALEMVGHSSGQSYSGSAQESVYYVGGKGAGVRVFGHH